MRYCSVPYHYIAILLSIPELKVNNFANMRLNVVWSQNKSLAEIHSSLIQNSGP